MTYERCFGNVSPVSNIAFHILRNVIYEIKSVFDQLVADCGQVSQNY